MIVFTPQPIPIVTPLGDGYLIYVQSGEMFENDIWTICLCDGGTVKHFSTDQIKIFNNATFQINKNDKKEGS